MKSQSSILDVQSKSVGPPTVDIFSTRWTHCRFTAIQNDGSVSICFLNDQHPWTKLSDLTEYTLRFFQLFLKSQKHSRGLENSYVIKKVPKRSPKLPPYKSNTLEVQQRKKKTIFFGKVTTLEVQQRKKRLFLGKMLPPQKSNSEKKRLFF